MNKKYLKKVSVLVVIILLILMMTSVASAKEMIVHSWNDFAVAVKDYCNDPGVSIGEIEPGEIIDVRAYQGEKSEWAEIWFEGTTAYIKTQYLRDPYSYTSELHDEEECYWSLYDPMENPLPVVAPNPKRITGFVYLRFSPESEGRIAKRMSTECVMTVLAEIGNWFQVREEISGIVGFVRTDEVVPIQISEQRLQQIQDSYD